MPFRDSSNPVGNILQKDPFIALLATLLLMAFISLYLFYIIIFFISF